MEVVSNFISNTENLPLTLFVAYYAIATLLNMVGISTVVAIPLELLTLSPFEVKGVVKSEAEQRRVGYRTQLLAAFATFVLATYGIHQNSPVALARDFNSFNYAISAVAKNHSFNNDEFHYQTACLVVRTNDSHPDDVFRKDVEFVVAYLRQKGTVLDVSIQQGTHTYEIHDKSIDTTRWEFLTRRSRLAFEIGTNKLLSYVETTLRSRGLHIAFSVLVTSLVFGFPGVALLSLGTAFLKDYVDTGATDPLWYAIQLVNGSRLDFFPLVFVTFLMMHDVDMYNLPFWLLEVTAQGFLTLCNKKGYGGMLWCHAVRTVHAVVRFVHAAIVTVLVSWVCLNLLGLGAAFVAPHCGWTPSYDGRNPLMAVDDFTIMGQRLWMHLVHHHIDVLSTLAYVGAIWGLRLKRAFVHRVLDRFKSDRAGAVYQHQRGTLGRIRVAECFIRLLNFALPFVFAVAQYNGEDLMKLPQLGYQKLEESGILYLGTQMSVTLLPLYRFD